MKGITSVREAIFNYFENHFNFVNYVRPNIKNLLFISLSFSYAYVLDIPFIEEDAK